MSAHNEEVSRMKLPIDWILSDLFDLPKYDVHKMLPAGKTYDSEEEVDF